MTYLVFSLSLALDLKASRCAEYFSWNLAKVRDAIAVLENRYYNFERVESIAIIITINKSLLYPIR
jgi:hypothetical protein